MQYGTLVHGVGHIFHHHEDDSAEYLCDTYLAAERLADACFQHLATLLEQTSFDSEYQASFWVSIQSWTMRPRSRAPPLSVFS